MSPEQISSPVPSTGATVRLFASVAALVMMTFGGWGCGDDDGDCQCPADDVINCGHRGTGTSRQGNPFPENTIPSFEQAVLEGADMVELDVQHSADGALVVIHDDTVNRTTDATGCVGDLSLDALGALDAARGTTLEGTGVTIPTLQEVFDALEVHVNVEIKIGDRAECPASSREALAEDVVAAIHADPKDRRLVVSSFDLDVLLEVQARDPSIHLGYITLVPTDAALAETHGFAALNVLGNLLDGDDVSGILDRGLEVNVWTINDGDLMESLFSWGVSMIITDAPDLFTTQREAFCATWCGR